MGFLDNSGDIIFDIVLTDAGRQRLARGDGSFKIVQFALFDDEIDYSDVNMNHPSGSAYYALDVLQTPILQAFTNNTAYGRSKLITYPSPSLLYLPVIKLSTNLGPGGGTYGSTGYYLVSVNDATIQALGVGQGIVDGQSAQTAQRTPIVFEQGLDTLDLSSQLQIPNDLKESQYFVKINSDLGEIVTPNGNAQSAEISFIDDDRIAFYAFSVGTTGQYIKDIPNNIGNSSIAGPRGTMFSFGIKASLSLASSNSLFTKYGSTVLIGSTTYKYLDTIVRIEGGTTGFTVDLPIRFIKA